MNPYSFILNDMQLNADSQGDLSALWSLVKLYEAGYTSGYTHHGGGSAYRYLLAVMPECPFKKYVARLVAPKVVLA